MRRIKYGKFGLAENPLHYHVSMEWKGRTLLGEVVGTEIDHYTGSFFLDVRHFCGDPWPVKPCAASVKVLE